MSLLGIERRRRPLIVGVGLFGAALIYGDGTITPAISVLSALEGFAVRRAWTTDLSSLPLTVVILVALFAAQPLGTARIGRAFGPIMSSGSSRSPVLGLDVAGAPSRRARRT